MIRSNLHRASGRPRATARFAMLATALLVLAIPATAVAKKPAQSRVVAGTPADPTLFPYIVAVQSGGETICTGSLITPDRVLTAAHCIPDLVNGDRVIVGAGETRTIIHVAQDPRLTALRDRPSDDGGVQPFDVAILQLNAPITTIAPIRLAQPADGALYAGGAPLTTIGFGSVDGDGNGSGVLRFAHVQARSDAECSALLAPLDAADSFVGAAMTCTTDPDKVAPFSSGCYGDSGGPLVAQATDGTLVQVGVDDWGVACGFKNGDPENYVEVPVIAAFALAAAPSWRPEPTRRPKFTGTVKVGRKVRCSLPRFSPAAPPDKVSRGFFRLVRTADGNEFRLVGRGASLRIKRKLRGKRLTCAAVGHSPGGTVVTYALRTKKVAR